MLHDLQEENSIRVNMSGFSAGCLTGEPEAMWSVSTYLPVSIETF